MRVICQGGVRTVSGSRFLCEHDGTSFLVDCGMLQGGREADRTNRGPFRFDPGKLDMVLLTHAHIDHSGLLPLLVREGFRGRIYATPATVDLCGIMLPDSAHIQEMEAEWQTRKNARRGARPVEPLYTTADAEKSLRFLHPVPYNQPLQLSPSIHVCFHDAGHILGSAFLEIAVKEADGEKKVVFSGDLGHPGQMIVRDHEALPVADFVFMESTYGNRLHRSLEETLEEFAGILMDAERRRGKIIIPAFAVERTQEVLFALHRLQSEGLAPVLPVYLDSPLAISATLLFRRHPECFDSETMEILDRGDNPLEMPSLTFVKTAEESRKLNELDGPMIIISAGGMCNAGRIKHHLKHNLWREENHVVIVGFQAQGTTGRRLVDGEKKVRIFREDVHVRASIHTLGGFSGHADRRALEEWIGAVRPPPERVFLVHGEEAVSLGFADRLAELMPFDVEVPVLGQEILLGRAGEAVDRAPVPEDSGRTFARDARGLSRRMQIVSELLDGKDWGSKDPLRVHRIRKQLGGVSRLIDKLEELARG